jgi:hypothetical protein
LNVSYFQFFLDGIRTNNSISTTNIVKTLLELKSDVSAQAKEIDELKQSGI